MIQEAIETQVETRIRTIPIDQIALEMIRIKILEEDQTVLMRRLLVEMQLTEPRILKADLFAAIMQEILEREL
jgi:hypothetical protein